MSESYGNNQGFYTFMKLSIHTSSW